MDGVEKMESKNKSSKFLSNLVLLTSFVQRNRNDLRIKHPKNSEIWVPQPSPPPLNNDFWNGSFINFASVVAPYYHFRYANGAPPMLVDRLCFPYPCCVEGTLLVSTRLFMLWSRHVSTASYCINKYTGTPPILLSYELEDGVSP